MSNQLKARLDGKNKRARCRICGQELARIVELPRMNDGTFTGHVLQFSAGWKRHPEGWRLTNRAQGRFDKLQRRLGDNVGGDRTIHGPKPGFGRKPKIGDGRDNEGWRGLTVTDLPAEARCPECRNWQVLDPVELQVVAFEGMTPNGTWDIYTD